MARLKIEGAQGFYHLCGRTAGRKDSFPLNEDRCQRKLAELLKQLSSVWFCSVAGFAMMGNHYHLVIFFEQPCKLSRKELRRRALLHYPGQEKMLDAWHSGKWKRFNDRIFDVSEFMRSYNASFARWYNRTHNRRGRFWADRFKSTLLENERAVLDCLLYIELNPVRAGLVRRPEDYQNSSLFLREIKKDGWLVPLPQLTGMKNRKTALIDFKARLYLRGSISTKANQKAIPKRVVQEEIDRGFKTQGVYRKRVGYFVDGVALGTTDFIDDVILLLRERGVYEGRKHPKQVGQGRFASVRTASRAYATGT
jgi:REP element-mobilizing transposase RayT